MNVRFCIKAIISFAVIASLLLSSINLVYGAVVLDSYTAATAYGFIISKVHWGTSSAQAQSWNQHLYDKAKVTSIKVKAYKHGSPTGTLRCRIASHTGTWGSTGKPDVDLEESTNSYNIASLSTLSNRPTTITFTFAGDAEILKDTAYTFYVYCSNGVLDGSNYVVIQGYLGHDGNRAQPTATEGIWGSSAQNDLYFQVYGEEIPSGEWHDITSWNFNLTTRAWLTASTWNFNLSARQWLDVALWTFNLTIMQWQNIATWGMNLTTMAWHTIATWTFNLITKAWNNITQWTFQVISKTWHNIINWNFDLISLGWHAIAHLVFQISTTNIPILFIGLLFFCALIFTALLLAKRKND